MFFFILWEKTVAQKQQPCLFLMLHELHSAPLWWFPSGAHPALSSVSPEGWRGHGLPFSWLQWKTVQLKWVPSETKAIMAAYQFPLCGIIAGWLSLLRFISDCGSMKLSWDIRVVFCCGPALRLLWACSLLASVAGGLDVRRRARFIESCVADSSQNVPFGVEIVLQQNNKAEFSKSGVCPPTVDIN